MRKLLRSLFIVSSAFQVMSAHAFASNCNVAMYPEVTAEEFVESWHSKSQTFRKDYYPAATKEIFRDHELKAMARRWVALNKASSSKFKVLDSAFSLLQFFGAIRYLRELDPSDSFPQEYRSELDYIRIILDSYETGLNLDRLVVAVEAFKQVALSQGIYPHFSQLDSLDNKLKKLVGPEIESLAKKLR